MGRKSVSLKISTPGRVCLFGEHQDYLQLPIVACAISLRISIEGTRRNDKLININLPDILEKESFAIDEPIIYTRERDYFKSSLVVLLRKSYTFSSGFDCVVEGKIPINAGTSSSSALIVTWINFLTRMSDQAVTLAADELAKYAYEAEVLEFSEPGGMMDQYSTSIGGIIYMDFFPSTKVTRLDTNLKSFVLGNSGQPKDTKFILSNVKDRILKIDSILKKIYPTFSLQTIQLDDIKMFKEHLTEAEYKILDGTLRNRDLTYLAKLELEKQNPDHYLIGKLMNEHHIVLSGVLGISTIKIDGMIKAAIDSGAYGGKINGSGGGGCMFAYAPEDPERVKSAIENAGGEAYIIQADSGSREEVMVPVNG